MSVAALSRRYEKLQNYITTEKYNKAILLCMCSPQVISPPMGPTPASKWIKYPYI